MFRSFIDHHQANIYLYKELSVRNTPYWIPSMRTSCKHVGSHEVYCALIVPFTIKCWSEDGLRRDRNMYHIRVLMIVYVVL